MPVMFVVMFLMSFYLGMKFISEPYGSWSSKVNSFFNISLLMIGIIAVLGLYATKNIDLGMVARTNADLNLWMAAICFVVSAGVGVLLLVFNSPDESISAYSYGLYGGMLAMLAFGIIGIGAFTWQVSRNMSRLIDLKVKSQQ